MKQRRAYAFGFATVLVFLPYGLAMTSSGCSDNKMPDVLGDPPNQDTGTGKKDTGPDVITLGDAGPCDVLPLGGYVTETVMSGNAPAVTGGTIEDGFYILTAAQVYGMGSTTTYAQSLLIQKGTLHLTKQFKGETTKENIFASYTVDPDGGPTNLAIDVLDCNDAAVDPDGGSSMAGYGYTATPTSFTLQRAFMAGTGVAVYTKQ